MRLTLPTVFCALAFALVIPAVAAATNVTIDGTPVSGAIVRDGHILVPFRVPMEQLGATVVWSDSEQTGVASYSGQELVRTSVGSPVAYVGGNELTLTVAPVLVEHLEYVPVEVLPEISHATLSLTPDGSTATITNFDLAGVTAAGAGASSNDPRGRILYLWLWILPIAGILCLVSYAYVNRQMNRSLALSAARTGRPVKRLGLFV